MASQLFLTTNFNLNSTDVLIYPGRCYTIYLPSSRPWHCTFAYGPVCQVQTAKRSECCFCTHASHHAPFRNIIKVTDEMFIILHQLLDGHVRDILLCVCVSSFPQRGAIYDLLLLTFVLVLHKWHLYVLENLIMLHKLVEAWICGTYWKLFNIIACW